MAKTKALSPEAKATCVGRAGRGRVACGSKGLVLTLLSPVVAPMAFRTASDDAITSEFGAPPATIPLVGATARRELVGAGRASSGQGVGRNRTLLSPETPLKPTSYFFYQKSTTTRSIHNDVEKVTYISNNIGELGSQLSGRTSRGVGSPQIERHSKAVEVRRNRSRTVA